MEIKLYFQHEDEGEENIPYGLTCEIVENENIICDFYASFQNPYFRVNSYYDIFYVDEWSSNNSFYIDVNTKWNRILIRLETNEGITSFNIPINNGVLENIENFKKKY